MIPPTEAQLQTLRSAIVDAKPPYCAGTLPLHADDLVISYGKEEPGSCRRIDFSNVDEDALKHLSDSCDKATFGRNQEDILDESYRKAGKMDTAYFSSKIDVELSALASWLLSATTFLKELVSRFRLQGKDSFFKLHKVHSDTSADLIVGKHVPQTIYAPRGTTVFVSLVVVLPTSHEGGALAIRHSEKEWSFDSAKALLETSDPHMHIAYATFFTDVEHAVTPIKSGYRVTLTYNLYFNDNAAFRNAQLLKSVPANQSLVKDALQAVLDDDEFLPKGGHLGFGLRHGYPVEIKPKDTSTLEFLARSLKGSDAMIMKACKVLDLEASLRISYDGDSYCRDEVLVKRETDINGRLLLDLDEPLKVHLMNNFDAKMIKMTRHSLHEPEEKPDFEFHWVAERTQSNALEATFATYGNEPGAEHVHGLFCLIVKIGVAGSRATSK